MLSTISPRRIFWVSFALTLAFFILTAWPGWIQHDSILFFDGATRGPIFDAHTPLFIWAWRNLGAEALGPLVPFLLKAILFWAGLALIAGRLQRLGWKTSWVLFPLVLLLDATWSVAWMDRDSFQTTFLIVMIGLAASTDVIRNNTPLWILVGLFAAASVSLRWYFFLIVLVALGALFLLASPVSRRHVLITFSTFGISLIVLFSFEKIAIDVEPTYPAASVLMLDIARVECAVGSPKARESGTSLFPPELIRQRQGSDICERFEWFIHDPLTLRFSHPTEPTGMSYVYPNSEANMERLQERWFQVAKEHFTLLGEARVRQVASFLAQDPDQERSTGLWWSPSKLLESGSMIRSWSGVPIYFEGSMGRGEEIGWPSLSRAPLVLSAHLTHVVSLIMPNSFGSHRFPLFSIVVLPIVAIGIGWRRGLEWRRRYLLALWFPFIFVVLLSLIALAADFRYIMPAALWSLAVSGLAITDRCKTDYTTAGPKTEHGYAGRASRV